MAEIDYASPETNRARPGRRRYVVYAGVFVGVMLGALQAALMLRWWAYDIDGPPLALNGPLILMGLVLRFPWPWFDWVFLVGGTVSWGIYGWLVAALRRPVLVILLLVVMHGICALIASRLY